MSKDDFMILAVLGKGGFGEVYLSRKLDTGEVHLSILPLPPAFSPLLPSLLPFLLSFLLLIYCSDMRFTRFILL